MRDQRHQVRCVLKEEARTWVLVGGIVTVWAVWKFVL
jgi:hypothetical protein